ncbi:MAG: KH domain-containing protein [Candidatus Vogelbacteria bacterium]|nr:KH domain-containing protein [Candidatus Vogelbacteria bacterium]
MEKDQVFLEALIKALVDHPESVKITRVVDEMGVLLTLDVHPEDMGKVIGRSGNTAKAIRTLLRVVGMKNNARVNLKISEPEQYEVYKYVRYLIVDNQGGSIWELYSVLFMGFF